MRKLLLSAIALFALSAQNASAVNLTFQFDVNSSGPSMYACNAGIKHKLEGKVCYDKDAGKTCTPGCAAGDANLCEENTSPASCACTGENGNSADNQGGSYMDFASITYGPWVDNSEKFRATENVKISGGFGYDWSYLTDMTKASYENQIKDLTINLGSEIYGAEYFVDICYRGSQINYKGLEDLNFNLVSKVTVNNLKATDFSYQNLAGLKVKSETKCIMQDAFNYCDFNNLPGFETCGTHGKYTKLASEKRNLANKSTQLQELYNLPTITTGSDRAPKFCYTRYTFTEEPKKPTVRMWKQQKARICTYTEISEPRSK